MRGRGLLASLGRGLAGAIVWAALSAPGVTAADVGDARVHERRARQHFRAGDYEEALVELEAERRLDSTPDVVFRIALALDRLHRDGDAYRAYAEYVAMTEEDEGDRLRRQAERSLRRVGRRVARVRVGSDPAGAEVFVDDEDAAAATTPGLLVLAPGEHRLRVRLDGHRTHEATVDAVRGEEVEVSAQLAPEPGVLVVEAPDGARVSVRGPDGETLGAGAAPLRLELPPGAYEAAVMDDEPAWRQVQVVAGDTHTERLATADERTRARAPRRAVGGGELRVAANPPGTRVFVDGSEVGRAPLALTDLRPGRHALRLEAEGVEPWVGRVELPPDEPLWVTGALAPPQPTRHSPWSYVALGTGGASVIAAIFTGIVAVTMRNDFEELTNPANPMPAAGLREQGIVVNGVTDALWVVGSLGVAAGIVLYVLTEERTGPQSDVTVTRGAR